MPQLNHVAGIMEIDWESSELVVPEGYDDGEQRDILVNGAQLSVRVVNEEFTSSVVVNEESEDTRVVRFRGEPEEFIILDEVGVTDADWVDEDVVETEDSVGSVLAEPTDVSLSPEYPLPDSPPPLEPVPAGSSSPEYPFPDSPPPLEPVPAGFSGPAPDTMEPVLAGSMDQEELLVEVDSDFPTCSRRSYLCDICQQEVPNKHARRHFEEVHLPWFYSPHTACAACKTNASALCFLRSRHDEREGHPAASFRSDQDLLLWVSRIAGMLHFFRACYGQADLEGLRQQIVSQGLAAQGYSFTGNWEGLLLVLDQYLGLPEHAHHDVGNPTCVSALLHWRTLSNILAKLSPLAREHFLILEYCSDFHGGLSFPVSPWTTSATAIDAHCHLDRTLQNHGVETLTELSDLVSGGRTVKSFICNFVFPNQWSKHENFLDENKVKFTFGIHPRAPTKFGDLSQLKWLLCHKKTVAIGELGFTLPAQDIRRQRQLVRDQLDLAETYRLPVIVHCQGPNSHKEMLNLLPHHISKHKKVQLHCFDGDTALIQRYLKVVPRCMFSISGLLLINSPDLPQAVQSLDLAHILLETDAPYLAPPGTPFHRNHPWNIYQVAERVAELKNLPVRVVVEAARHNAERFFDL